MNKDLEFFTSAGLAGHQIIINEQLEGTKESRKLLSDTLYNMRLKTSDLEKEISVKEKDKQNLELFFSDRIDIRRKKKILLQMKNIIDPIKSKSLSRIPLSLITKYFKRKGMEELSKDLKAQIPIIA